MRRLARLLQLPLGQDGVMDAVTGGARHAARFVLASVPQRVLATQVARGAGRARLISRHGLEGQRLDAGGILGMFAAGSMTRFTALFCGRRARIRRAVVRRVQVLLHDGAVTRQTCVLAHVGGARRHLRGHFRLRGIHRRSGILRRLRGRLNRRRVRPHRPKCDQPHYKCTGNPGFRTQSADVPTHKRASRRQPAEQT